MRTRCTRCEQFIDEDRIVWLELNGITGVYTNNDISGIYTDNDISPEESQGWFPFGADCAGRELSSGRSKDHNAT